MPHHRRARGDGHRVTAAAALVLLLVAGVVGATGAGAARPPVRYLDPVFADVTITSDLTYGSALNQDGVMQSLELDVYEPTGDTATVRPLVVWIHGGSFAYGDKAGPLDTAMAQALAQRGFVVASIEYRLAPEPITGALPYSPSDVIAIGQAYNDARTAVAWLRAHAGDHAIDTDLVLAAGYSAGAGTALHLAVMPNRAKGQGTATDPSHVDGAVVMAGTTPPGFVEPGEGPLLFLHGTDDSVVPYSSALAVHDAALSRGVDSTMVPFPGDDHDLTDRADEVQEHIGWWAHERWLAAPPDVTGLTPRIAPHAGPTEVTITGTGFSGATAVHFGSDAAVTFTAVDDTTIRAVPAPHQAGVVAATVSGPAGTSSVDLRSLFRYDGPAWVARTTPNTGPTAGGGVVDVRGGGFTGTTMVTVGGVPATFAVVNDHLLTVVVPARPAGPVLVNVAVTDDIGTTANTPASWYRYE